MRKRRVLYILNKPISTFKSNRQHTNWVHDCSVCFDIEFWGKGINKDLSLSSLKNKIDKFKPCYIYLSIRKRYEDWLPNLSSISVPKIFVEMDTWHYSPNDSWYKQFDILMCRCPWWNGWDKIPFFPWSVPNKAFPTKKDTRCRRGIYFIGQWLKQRYPTRKAIKRKYSDVIKFCRAEKNRYWELLHSANIVICPTESSFGDFIPAKLFEYLASGPAIITNCDIKKTMIKDIDDKVILYKEIEDIPEIIKSIDPVKYHNKAVEIMRNHTHLKRYSELFR